jgi:hypothetical protein
MNSELREIKSKRLKSQAEMRQEGARDMFTNAAKEFCHSRNRHQAKLDISYAMIETSIFFCLLPLKLPLLIVGRGLVPAC